MPRQRGLIKLQGTLEDLNFYLQNGRYLVRRKTGVDAERIARDPVFGRTRENASEFAEVMRIASLCFRALGVGGRPSPDPRMHLRLKQVLFRLRDLDEGNGIGDRSPATALATPQGLAMLRGFPFRPGEGPEEMLGARISTEPRGGGMRIEGLEPSLIRGIPAAATHLRLSACRVDIDLIARQYLRSKAVTEVVPLASGRLTLTLDTGAALLPRAMTLFTLWIGFAEAHPTQEILYPLNPKVAGGIVGAHGPWEQEEWSPDI